MPIKKEKVTLKRIIRGGKSEFEVTETLNFMTHLPGDTLSEAQAKTLKQNSRLEVRFTKGHVE